MSARITPCLVFVALVGCAGPDRTESPPPTTGGTTASTSTQAATCMPSGLEAAHEVEIVRLPAGCSFSGGGSLEAPAVLADEAALAAGVSCADGASPTIALGEDQLMVARFTMSPAFGGLAIVDDGTTVTYVMRDRPPCPGDPMPMPTPTSALAFRLPRGATRTFRQLACTLPRTCG